MTGSSPHRSVRRRGAAVRGLVAALGGAVIAVGQSAGHSAGHAADLPPDVVARFTRGVQPLVLNRCAAGACHGGPAGHEPRFERADAGGTIDRRRTLANLATLLDAVGPERDPQPLVTLLAVRHPAAAGPRRPVAPPLSARERVTLETWLAAVRAAERAPRVDPAVRPAGGPNRFRELLDAAANPPELPPPAEPQGIIFPRDVPPAEEGG